MFKISTNVYADVYYVDSEFPLFMERIESKNQVTNSGRNVIRNVMAQPDSELRGSYKNVYFHWGTGGAGPAAGDTGLTTTGNPKAITEANIDDNYQITYKYYMPSTEANTVVIAEAGLFFGNQTTDNTMLARVVLSSTITKTADKAITFTWVQAIAATT